jgi:hypothetical protein
MLQAFGARAFRYNALGLVMGCLAAPGDSRKRPFWDEN